VLAVWYSQVVIIDVVSHWLMTAEACVQFKGSLCGNCVGWCDIGLDFYLRTVIFLRRGYSTNPYDSYFIHLPLVLYIMRDKGCH
jgi:hypothetical protein